MTLETTLFFIVLGYGADRYGWKIDEYLSSMAIEYVDKKTHGFKRIYIIVTGGFTGSGRSAHISEAAMMKAVLVEKGIPEEAILMEERSVVTIENFRGALEIIQELSAQSAQTSCPQVIIFYDSSREEKVVFFAKEIFRPYFLVDFRPFDFERPLTKRLFQKLIFPVEKYSYKYPLLETIITWIKMTVKGIKHRAGT